MKQVTALALALSLLVVAAPVVAHDAGYPQECDDRKGKDECQKDRGREPNHKQCTGERNWMTSSRDSLVEEAIGIAGVSGDPIVAYAYAPGDEGTSGPSGTPMPGVLWIEDNGFNGLQRTDWKCKSGSHDDPSEWNVHADKVLI